MPKKIYDYAKDMNVGPLELVEKLREFGFSIRNHMSTLSDDEIQRFNEIFLREKERKMKVKAKTVRKKRKAKVVNTPASVVSTASKGGKNENREDNKELTSKRKVLVRRKMDKVVEQKIKEDLHIQKEPEEVIKKELLEEQIDKEDKKELTMPKQKTGLKVVTRKKSDKKVHSSLKKEDDIFQERMHVFTPVYIPPPKVAEKDSNDSRGEKDNTSSKKGKEPTKVESVKTPESKKEPPADDKASASKKRMGGLAAIVTKAKGKTRDIVQIKADEELKLYGVGIVGKVIYSNVGKKRVYQGPSRGTVLTEVKDSKRVVQVHSGIYAQDLALKLHIKFEVLRDTALDINLLIKIDDYLGISLAKKIADIFKYRVEDMSFKEENFLPSVAENSTDESLSPRNPIVTVMGHVDHGKTTLLDFIRNTKVQVFEHGGITQHIGAYKVKVGNSSITFLDTPGHAAFKNMRSRGVQITDIVILVVAADDGVMPQTKECITFCKENDVPIVVAINKIDKEGVSVDRVKKELTAFDLTPEEWGGHTQYVEISALKGQGIDKLMEAIALQAEIMELKANSKGPVSGLIIESQMAPGRGPIVTSIIQSGTLRKGDYVVIGEYLGRVRNLLDYSGKIIKSAGPSTPVSILGLSDPANPGDTLNVVKNERQAKKIAENRSLTRKELAQTPKAKMNLEDFLANKSSVDEEKILKLIIRADVLGSYEAIKASLQNLGNDEVRVQVIGGGVGAITDSDVQLAKSAEGYIIGFMISTSTTARRLSEDLGVDVKIYKVIYELIKEVNQALEGLLAPEQVERYIGRALVKEIFNIPKIGSIAGSSVLDGKIERGCFIRLLRDSKIIHEGPIGSLKRFKDDVKEVKSGYECGISLENYKKIQVDDIFEAFVYDEVKRKLESDIGS